MPARRRLTVFPQPFLAGRVLWPAVILCLLLFPQAGAGAAQAAAPPPVPTITSLAVLAAPPDAPSVAWAIDQYQAGRFLSLPDKVFTASGEQTYWLRVGLAVPPGLADQTYALDLNWPFLRLLQAYLPGQPLAMPAARSEWNFYQPAPVPLPPHLSGEIAVYIRLAGYGSINLNPVIVNGRDAARQARLRPWVLGLFFGLLGSMLAYNLFLFVSLRDASYGYYVANAALLILYYFFSTGMPGDILPLDSRTSLDRLLRGFHLVAALLFANMGLFTRSFLLTRRASPSLDRILIGQILLALLLVPLDLLFPIEASFTIAPSIGMLTAVVILLAAVVRLVQGFRPAVIFVVGWGFYVLCGAVHSMTWAGILAATPATIHAPMVGTAAEVFIMSLALAYRIKLLRDHARLADQERQRLAVEKARSDEACDTLARENTLLALVLDDHRFGIGVVQDGRFQFANRQLARHLGRDDVAGQLLTDVPQAARFLGVALDMSAERDSEREVVLGENGSGRTLRAAGRLLDPARPELGTVYLVEDVSDARRLEQLKNDIDQVMRHDLKSPLATIAGIREALELAGPLTERQQRLTAMLERTVAEMTSRINLSLALYKIEAGSLRLTPGPAPLARLLEDARLELAPFLSAGGRLDIAYDAPPGAFVVLGEPTLLLSLWVNLFKNALEAAAGAGAVTVAVSDPGAPRVAITNPGEVPPDVRDRFFEKYATSGKPGGAGLGAYSARRIARAFGGDVTLDASRPGLTTVTVIGLPPA
ncbi:7TM diverse intracellular signaling domain-containing protein [Desulfovibrio sp. TomC]|uniref:7TM diverse intracellular signaling domain-containing protein n=1 Tax=Desulfovibrio sp. TomC TaxID=1562888 RepID=UPI0005754DA1|nr:7TM diverse intracellular signaling domain-containing protein [Desulfovibrio sp. TomC]KHK03171.1 diguanylate cyclase (GGDEF domain) with PAS/PAC sensor [Desulfovibrio sp. TomC]